MLQLYCSQISGDSYLCSMISVGKGHCGMQAQTRHIWRLYMSFCAGHGFEIQTSNKWRRFCPAQRLSCTGYHQLQMDICHSVLFFMTFFGSNAHVPVSTLFVKFYVMSSTIFSTVLALAFDLPYYATPVPMWRPVLMRQIFTLFWLFFNLEGILYFASQPYMEKC
jgi:hypothetical protein